MRTLQEFLTKTHLEKNRIKLTLLLIIPSLLYSMIYPFVKNIIYMGSAYIYYAALYILVIGAAYVFLIIFFQFLLRKRGMETKLKLTSYILPLLGVQTILFIVMIGSGALTLLLLLQGDSMLSYIMNPLCILLFICYIPMQIFSFIALYDGMKNPFQILWVACKKMVKHYRICFYSVFTLALFAFCYQLVLETSFGFENTFVPFMAVQNIVISANPFIHTMEFVTLLSSADLWIPLIISVVYGILMCMLLAYFYMLMICAYDEDIKI